MVCVGMYVHACIHKSVLTLANLYTICQAGSNHIKNGFKANKSSFYFSYNYTSKKVISYKIDTFAITITDALSRTDCLFETFIQYFLFMWHVCC